MPTSDDARRIAQENFEFNSELVEAYWFPHPEEYRLVYVDPYVVPAEEKLPLFQFKLQDTPTHVATLMVAVIRPEEVGKLLLPEGWGEWHNAKRFGRPEAA
jgi:hypothetical protein